jgi:Flp pilus assembly protein TadG
MRKTSLLRAAMARPRSSVLSIWSDSRGVAAVILGLVAMVVIGIVGLGVDVVTWYRTDRAMQNAADSAAIAAAINGGPTTYQNEAKAVAAQYGFVDNSNGVHVTAVNGQTCPDGETNCYKVTVAMDTAPQFFSQVVGLPAPPLSSAAMAGGDQIHQYCLLALASDGTTPAITSHGAASANMTGCNIMSNTGSTCTGHNLQATNGDAHGTNSGCGINEHSNVKAVSDPYAYLASNIPTTNPCSSYYTEYGVKKPPPPPKGYNGIWGAAGVTTTIPLGSTPTTICGDLQLQGNVTVSNTSSGGSVLVIRNGVLDVGNYVLSTASGAALTIIFTGPDASGSYNHFPASSSGSSATDCSVSCINIQAPTTGTWSGVAIYQDPNLPAGSDVNVTYTGNAPTWDITGLIYLPHANTTFSGAVNKSSYGASCFVLVVDSILINGTGSIEETGGCAAAGLTMPQDTVQGASLVQ